MVPDHGISYPLSMLSVIKSDYVSPAYDNDSDSELINVGCGFYPTSQRGVANAKPAGKRWEQNRVPNQVLGLSIKKSQSSRAQGHLQKPAFVFFQAGLIPGYSMILVVMKKRISLVSFSLLVFLNRFPMTGMLPSPGTLFSLSLVVST